MGGKQECCFPEIGMKVQFVKRSPYRFSASKTATFVVLAKREAKQEELRKLERRGDTAPADDAGHLTLLSSAAIIALAPDLCERISEQTVVGTERHPARSTQKSASEDAWRSMPST
mgnify:CR=1 FL=1